MRASLSLPHTTNLAQFLRIIILAFSFCAASRPCCSRTPCAFAPIYCTPSRFNHLQQRRLPDSCQAKQLSGICNSENQFNPQVLEGIPDKQETAYELNLSRTSPANGGRDIQAAGSFESCQGLIPIPSTKEPNMLLEQQALFRQGAVPYGS